MAFLAKAPVFCIVRRLLDLLAGFLPWGRLGPGG